MTGGRAEFVALSLMLAVGALALWPLAWLGFPLHSDDIKYHAGSAQQFFEEMRAGTIYPRWLTGMNGGLGSPFLYFYGPVSFWLTSLAAAATGVRDGIQTVEMVFCATLLASGCAAYAWLRSMGSRTAACLGAALYMVLPYHMTIDLWTRAAFYEFNAFALTPLVFLGIDWLRQGRRWGGVLLPVAFMLLIMTHIVTAMLVTVMAGAYVLLGGPSLRSLVATALAFLSGLLLAGAYLGAALGLREFTSYQAQAIQATWFLSPVWDGFAAGRLMQMLTVVVVVEMAFTAGVAVWMLRRPAGPTRRLVLIWAGLTMFTLLCMTRSFEPFWNRVPILRNAQFPFRILTVSDLGVATLAALCLDAALSGMRRPIALAGAIMAGLATFGILEALVPIQNGAFGRADWKREFAVQGDYKWFRPLASVDKLPMDIDPAQAPAVPAARIMSGPATAALIGRVGLRYSVTIDAQGPAVFDLGQLYFPGWRARIGNTELPVRPSAGMGLVEVDVPGGRYTLEVALTPTPVEQAGWAVSGVGLLLWAGMAGWAWRARGAVRVAA